MPSESHRVTDDAGVEFVLGPEIAAGKQGTVYRVQGHPEKAIKLLTRETDLARIPAVRRLPLDGLSVAAPTTLIRNGGAGYVMPLASDMTPIREPYLPREFGARETTAQWYAETGGLRRRLAIAANIAQTIAALHERGLAYVDLNPNNVMVSDDLSRTETWLIDTDNLTSRAAPAWDILGFPGYAAPERAGRGAPPSTLADTYVLAVHVFRLLTLRHPLEGKAADAADGDVAWGRVESGRFVAGRIDLGDFPYVADPHDHSNSLAARSFPAGIFPVVMSGRLRRLAAQTFGDGRLDPTKRPGSARWRDVLSSALDNVVTCTGGCGWTHYRLQPSCPNCGAATPPSALITVYAGSTEHSLAARDSLVVASDIDTSLLPRQLWGRHDHRDPVVTFRPVRGGFEVAAHDDAQIADAAGKPIARISTPKGSEVYRLRLSVPDRPARVLALRSVQPA